MACIDVRLFFILDQYETLMSAVVSDGMYASLQVRTDEWYDTGLHIAAFDATFGKVKPIFLQYKLPAVALPPPIQVGCLILPNCHTLIVWTFSKLSTCFRPGKAAVLHAAPLSQ